jgi:hypothetical protein
MLQWHLKDAKGGLPSKCKSSLYVWTKKHYLKTTSDREMTKINIIDLEKL